VGDKIEKNEMGGAFSAYGGGERRVQGFGGVPEGKRPLGLPRHRWEENFKASSGSEMWGVWTGSSWLRIGTVGWALVNAVMNLWIP